MTGKLRHLTNTHPDIEYALNNLCHHTVDPKNFHFRALLDLLGYLKKFPNGRLIYKKGKNNNLAYPTISAEVDETYNNDPKGGKSTYGFVISLNGMPVIWKS